MTPEEFDALFDSFRFSVFRLEALAAYRVGGAEATRIQAFQEGAPRPERSVRTSPWLARIAVSTATEHKQWQRVRVLDNPLTEYQRYQLSSYRESQAAGEQIGVLLRHEVSDLDLGEDFWLFDGETDAQHAVVMRYDGDGHFLGAEPVTDQRALGNLFFIRAHLVDRAKPLNEFLAGLDRG